MALPNNTPFPPELRTMTIVPRWSIVWTTQRDTVANHSYFVAIYAHMIGRIIKWNGPRDYLLMSALVHDIDEVITGDIVSPIKAHILDQERMQEYVDDKLQQRLGGLGSEMADLSESSTVGHSEEIDLIIKAADRLDALLFLIMEERRGNTVIRPLIRDAQNKLEAAWRDLPAEENAISYLWQTVMLPAIDAHRTEGGRGL